ncbi:MAG: hypothetical protein ABW221_03005 [Vicinamibacteria bacterium]
MSRVANRRATVRFVVLPATLLLVALLGGLRLRGADGAFVFLPPPLVTLCLAGLAMALFLRAGLVRAGAWVSAELPLPVSVCNALTLLALFAATAQAINSVLPEQGLLHWVFVLCFFWTLWQDQFTPWAVARLLRSLAVLFGTAFVLKHVVLGALYGGPSPGLSRRILNVVLEGVTLGALDAPAFAPATGYVSFATVALYVGALALLRPDPEAGEHPRRLVDAYRALPPSEQRAIRAALEDDVADAEITSASAALPETHRRR